MPVKNNPLYHQSLSFKWMPGNNISMPNTQNCNTRNHHFIMTEAFTDVFVELRLSVTKLSMFSIKLNYVGLPLMFHGRANLYS